MKHEIFWKNPRYEPRSPLQKDIECDYLVVGGGITGVTLAYFLAKDSGKRIVLIEKETIASGATGQAAGTLVLEGEVDLFDILKTFGSEKASLYWKAIHEALFTIKDLIERENLECDFEPQDAIYASSNRKHDWEIFEEYEMAKQMEQSVELVTGDKLKGAVNTSLFRHAIIYKDHGISVNPLAFTQNLSLATEKYGVTIYENTPLLRNKGHVAITPDGRIKFGKLIMAIDSATRHKKVRRRNSTIVVTQPLTHSELVSIGMVPKKIVWDTGNDYHYFKIMPDNRMLIGYGDVFVHKKHKDTAPRESAVKRIAEFMKKLFPKLNLRFEYGWSGSYGVTKSHMPVLNIRGNKWSIGGAGSQLVCLMAAKHIAHKLLGKHTGLDDFFEE